MNTSLRLEELLQAQKDHVENSADFQQLLAILRTRLVEKRYYFQAETDRRKRLLLTYIAENSPHLEFALRKDQNGNEHHIVYLKCQESYVIPEIEYRLGTAWETV